MDSEEVAMLLNQAELHIRILRGELNEIERSIDRIRRAF